MNNTPNNDTPIADAKSGVSLSLTLIKQWLKVLFDKTHTNDIEDALSTAKFLNLNEDEKEIFATIKRIYIAEMNGDLIPDPSIREIYASMGGA